jgi:tetratricopeptide (TPR) repeat protein
MKFLDIVIAEESSLKEKEEQAGSPELELPPTLEKLGYAYHALNRFEDAQQAYERALRLRLESGQAESNEVINCVHAIGKVFQEIEPEQYEKAKNSLDKLKGSL